MRDVEVKALRLAEVELPDFHPAAPGHDVVYAFLVRDGRDCILVDTGVGTGSALVDRLYKPNRVELSVALLQAGASLREVTAIVNSHLHFDHCGNNSLFPDIPIFVQQAELDAARQPHYTVPEWVDFPNANYVPIDGSHAISTSLALHPTPGHTPGHQSLVVRSGSHVEVVVAQAAYSAAEFQAFLESDASGPDSPGLRAYIESNASWSKEAYVASLDALRRTRPQRAFFSHDPETWESAG